MDEETKDRGGPVSSGSVPIDQYFLTEKMSVQSEKATQDQKYQNRSGPAASRAPSHLFCLRVAAQNVSGNRQRRLLLRPRISRTGQAVVAIRGRGVGGNGRRLGDRSDPSIAELMVMRAARVGTPVYVFANRAWIEVMVLVRLWAAHGKYHSGAVAEHIALQ